MEDLYLVLDYILNKAAPDELQVIGKALEKRLRNHSGPSLNVDSIARTTAKTINDQLTGSIDSMHSMVRNFVVDMIRQNAPNISDKEIDVLLKAWMPSERDPAERQSAAGNLPADALLSMVRQFVAVAHNQMPALDKARLDREIPGWEEKYWTNFPEEVRRLISLNLKGKISDQRFWDELENYLSTR